MPSIEDLLTEDDFNSIEPSGIESLLSPSDFETPSLEQTIFNQETGRTIAAPYGTNPEEVFYLDATQNLGAPQSDYFGYVKAAGAEVWDKASALGRGAFSSASTIFTEGSVYPSMMMADAYQEAIKGGERSFAEMALDVINPFAGPEKFMRLKADVDLTLPETDQQRQMTEASRVVTSSQRLLQSHQRWLKNSGLTKTDDAVEQVFFDIGGAATTTLSSIGLGVLTKNPMASVALMGQIQKNSSYIEAREKGFSPAAARNISAVMGAVEGGLEVIGFDKLMKIVEGDKILKNIFKYGLIEGFQEFTQTGAEEVIAQSTGLRPVDIPKAAQDALYSALIGSFVGGGSGGAIEILKSSGLNDDQAELYSQRITKVLGDIETRVAQIIDDETVKFNPEDPTVKKVTSILSKFSKGIDIDVRAEINALPNITEAKKEELISQIESGGLKSFVSAATDTLRGRISYLDEQIARIDDEWARLDDEITALEQEGKSTKAKTNRVEKLLGQRDALDQQRAEILTAETSSETDKVVRDTLNQDVKVKGRALTKLGLKTITGRAEAATTALRRARKIYQSDTQEAQKLVLQAIEESGLPAKSRAKFMNVMTKVTSSEKLTSLRPKQKQMQIDAITHRLQREIEQVQRREISNALDKVLKRMKPKKGGNRPVSKIDDAEMQEIFSRMRSANALSKEDASEKLNKNLASGASDIGTVYENKILALKSGVGSQSIGSMADLLLDLNAMQRGAKTATEMRNKQRKQRKNELKARVLQQILKGKDIREIDEQGIWKAIAAKVNKVRGVGASVQSSWEAFVDIPFGNDMALSKELYSIISDGLRAKRNFVVARKEQFANLAKEAYGIKSSNALMRKMMFDEKKINLGKFVLNGEKKAFSWKLSRSEARKIWMELKNDNLRETYMTAKNTKNQQVKTSSPSVSEKDTSYGYTPITEQDKSKIKTNGVKYAKEVVREYFQKNHSKETSEAVEYILSSLGDDVDIIFVGEGDYAPIGLASGQMTGVFVHTKGGRPKIYIRDSIIGNGGDTYETLAHEMLHAATLVKIELGNREKFKDTELSGHVRELFGLYEKIIKKFNSDLAIGKSVPNVIRDFYNRKNNSLADTHEILAWGLTDKGMQGYLKTIDIREVDGGRKSFWGNFVEIVGKILGIPTTKKYLSSLDDLIKISNKISSVSGEKWEGIIGDQSVYTKVNNNFGNDNGRTGNGFTEEMIQALDDFLTPEDKKFVDAQIALYDEMYDPVNEVYAQQNGINLPRGQNYSPIIRKHQSELVDVDEFMAGLENRISSANPSLVKTRVDNTNEILPQSDILAMQKYITGAGQYVGMIQPVTELNALFSDGQVAEAIRKTWGNTYYNALKSHLEDFTRGSIKRDEGLFKWVHGMNANVAKSLIFGKPNMWAKQMTAFVAYGAEIPAVNFAAGVSDFLVNFRTAIDVLSSTAYMKDRGASMDVEGMKNAYARVLNPSKFNYYNQRFDNLMSLWTKLGDRGAIYMGGWSVYKYHKDVLGKTHEEALVAFEEASKRTQQDINLDQRTRLQANPNPFVRMFTLFSSSQVKFLEREVEALRKWSRGQITTRDMAKKLAIYHVILPVFFQYVANAFDADDDEGSLERAALIGPLNGVFIAGDALTNIVASAYDVNYFEKPRGFTISLNKLQDQIKDVITKSEIDTKEFFEALGLLAGVPAKAIIGQYEGAEAIAEGDVEFGVLRMLGYTERTAEKALE